MNRRNLMLLLGGAMVATPSPRAQQKAMPVIGFLSGASPGSTAPYVAAFRQGLTETGWVRDKTWPSNTAGQRAALIDCPHWPPTSSAARSM